SAMDPEPRRWAATYTTQLRQKRKAYHDGVLLLRPDSRRLVLLDDAGVTIDARSLRAGESVSEGASVEFPCHLVDVGEAQRVPTTARPGRPSEPAAPRAAHRGGARARQSAANTCAPRAFVKPPKSGAGKTEATGSGCARSAGSTSQEWSAMYTTQVSQKAKRYHDGFLKLVQSGLYSKQIVLLDEEGQVLGTRHLKSGECVESGKKCSFPGYLIEIGKATNLNKGGDPKSSEEHMMQTRPKGVENANSKMGIGFDKSKSEATSSSNKPELGKSEVAAAGSTGSLMGSADSSFKEVEWSVLYTAQLIQKAKKFHDGVIRLVQAGPNVKQILLLDEEGGVLGTRYFNSGESIECGKRCQFPNYIIEVTELRNKMKDVEHTHAAGEASSHTVPKNGENTREKDDKSKSPKFVSPFRLHDHRKTKTRSTTDSNKPQVGKSACSNVGDPLNYHDFADNQRGTSEFSTSKSTFNDLGKSAFGGMDDPHKFDDIHRGKSGFSTSYNRPEVDKSILNRMDDPLKFCLRDGKSVCPTSFVGREVGKLTFGNADDSLRTASQILSIMKPPAGLSHFATQLRTSVQSCLKLDTAQAKNSVITHNRNELSGNAYRSYNHQAIMKPPAFDASDLELIDLPGSEMCNANEQKLESSGNLNTVNCNGTGSAPISNVTSMPNLREDKSGTADQLGANNTAEDPKYDSGPSRTCRDPTIQDLIDDCPSFDLGF
uniref:5'-3' DNA helicase ZGRF1-like N-terminal domain-containing protein n=1 Tax=Aegilops tauschii subsp. strangulata TaxID=200361 RepID=A0A453KPS7_AEGTS